MCLGLHPQTEVCADCGTPRNCLVTKIYDWMALRERIWRVYRDSITDHCGDTLAVQRAAEQCECSPRFVRKTLTRHNLATLT